MRHVQGEPAGETNGAAGSRLALLGDAHGLAAAACGLRVLALHAQAPVRTEAAVVPAKYRRSATVGHWQPLRS